MDRDTNFDRVEKAYNAMVVGTSVKEAKKVWKESQKNKVTDEFIVPVTTDKKGLIKDNDGIIFFNYRPDRLKELASIFTNKEYKSFAKEEIKNLKVGVTTDDEKVGIVEPDDAFEDQTEVDVFTESTSSIFAENIIDKMKKLYLFT
jgi:2,3-bisphosphoglycerate-independent phosphoglycerate mutase